MKPSRVPLIFVRVAIAAACLAGVFRKRINRALLRRHLGSFFLLGIVNSALPFSLLAYSTLSLEVDLVMAPAVSDLGRVTLRRTERVTILGSDL